MNSLTKTIAGGLVGIWALLASGGHLKAQQETAEGVAPEVPSARSTWQQRVLRPGRTNHPGDYSLPGPKYRTATRPTYPRPRANTVSMAVEASDQPEPLDADALQPTPILPETPYESAGAGVPETYAYGTACPDCGACGAWDGCYEGCGGCGGYYDGCGLGPWVPWLGWWARDLSMFAGVHGFKGPPDRGLNGNFGLHEGVNVGAPFYAFPGIGYQAGFMAVHSNFSGHQAASHALRGDRDQIFFTAGVFRRAPSGGWQWGVAFDLLHDSYYDRADLKQIRSETGYVLPGGRREIGYFGTYGTGGDDLILLNRTRLGLEPTDMFAFYYRRYFEAGGDGRLWAGFTGAGDGLLGADLQVPLGRGWALENRVNYLIPKQGRGSEGLAEESWGLTIQLVWYLGQPARSAVSSPYRPLFGVADNTTFMADAFRR